MRRPGTSGSPFFSATMGPAVTVHEVTPGHFAHGRMLRQVVRGDVRRSLFSEAFVEGWAQYAEELMVEQGFRADDPRFAIGVCLDGLVAVATGLASAIGIHREQRLPGRRCHGAFRG